MRQQKTEGNRAEYWGIVDRGSIMKLRILVGASAVVLAVVVACSIQNRPETREVAEPTAVNRVQETLDSGSLVGAESKGQAGLEGSPSAPLTEQEVATFHDRIKKQSSDLRKRIETRRALLAGLLERGPADRVPEELLALLEDVRASEGEAMARRTAFAEANTWQANKHYPAAVMAYQVVIDRWPESDFAVEALLHQGECQLELHEYANAEATFQGFVEQYDASALAGWGWRKLALAQLLQGDFDRSLATLELMEGRFKEGEFAEYARARRGYVLMSAGRTAEARKAYEEFLTECPSSKYCRLVKKQMDELEQAVSLTSVTTGGG